MSVLRGAAVGALGLTMLDVLVGTDQAANRAGGLLTGVSGLARAFMSTDVPAIRDRSGCLDGGGTAGHGKPAGVLGTAKKDAGSLFSVNPLNNPLVNPLALQHEVSGLVDKVIP